MHSDLNLLFGILAVQMDFLKQDALIAGMNAWVLNKNKSLGDLLVEQGALGRDRRNLLDALVQEHLKQHDNDPSKSLAAIGSADRVHEAMRQIADQDVQHSLGYMTAVPANVDPDATQAPIGSMTPSAGTLTSSGLRFHILRPHAGGGLGQVFVARDDELNREVALKEIKEKYADIPESRARFLLEAEITGGLEHPGIVPVYGLGTYGDGRPYYAMRFIRGDSLNDAIKRFHKAEAEESGRDPGERAIELRALLGRFIDVCNAIEYAHSRGVLHRDLKPDNVMLGKFGETLVVDWGLAKAVTQEDEPGLPHERRLQPLSAGSATPTQIGSAIGTPQYMSPEQAAGRGDLIGMATDVYSLGATLYCVLTGKSPFQDRDVGLILQKVQRGEFPPPREVNAKVPKALEAVCLKAMALEPAERYRTPQHLAGDIEHWLADEPVVAYDESSFERLARWTRRHRAWMRAIGGALVVVAIVAILASLLINNARRRESAARQQAETSFLHARGTVDDFFTRVSENRLLDVPALQPLRKDLLTDALTYYQGFIRERENDPTVRAELGATYYRVGLISGEIGSQDDALQALEKARAIQEPLLAATPDSPDRQRELADTYNAIGDAKQNAEQLDEALSWFQRAEKIRRDLAAKFPDDSAYQRKLANSLNNIATIYTRQNRIEDASDSLEQANRERAELVRREPNDAQLHNDLAQGRYNLGLFKRRQGDFAGALTSYREALESFGKAVELEPTAIDYRRELAVTQRVVADLLLETGARGGASETYETARQAAERLARANPLVTQLQADVAPIYVGIARLQFDTAPAASLDLLQRAQALLNQVVVEDPGVVRYRLDLAVCRLHLGMLHQQAGDLEQATAELREAISLFAALVEQDPAAVEAHTGLISAYLSLALVQRAAGQADEAAKSLQQAAGALDDVPEAWAETARLRELRAQVAYLQGLILLEAGQVAEALPHYEQSRTLRQTLVDEEPDRLEYQNVLGTTLDELGVLLWHLDRRDEALATAGQATAYLRTAHENAGGDPGARSALATHYLNLAILQRESGHLAESAALLAARRQLSAGNPAELYQVAVALTTVADAVGAGVEGELSAELQMQRSEYQRQAIEALRAAIAAGFDDWSTLDAEPALASLRELPEFKALRPADEEPETEESETEEP